MSAKVLKLPLPEHNPKNPAFEGAEVLSAPVISRILAFLIDYLCLLTLSMASTFLTTQFLGTSSDWEFLSTFLIGAAYFTWSHSGIGGGGQTMGKRLLRIQVLGCGDTLILRPLSLTQSFLRYLVAIGAVVLLTQLPPMLYRACGVVAPSWKLEFNMWGALVLSAINFLCFVISSGHRAFHDLTAQSLVVRLPENAAAENLISRTRPIGRLQLVSVILLGMLLGSVLWRAGLSRVPEIEAFSSYRYRIEQQFPLRFAGAEYGEGTLLLAVGLVEPAASRKGDGDKELASSLVRFLVEEKIIQSDSIKSVELQFLPLGPGSNAADHPNLIVNTTDFSATLAPV